MAMLKLLKFLNLENQSLKQWLLQTNHSTYSFIDEVVVDDLVEMRRVNKERAENKALS